MRQIFDIGRDLRGVQHPGWPPPVHPQFGPNDFAIQRHSSCLTVVTIVLVTRRLVQLKTLDMEGSWTLVTHYQFSGFRADKAPSHVDVGVDRLFLGDRRHVMLGTDDLCQCDLNGTGCHAVVIGMVSRGASEK